jgi:hypothetical protein
MRHLLVFVTKKPFVTLLDSNFYENLGVETKLQKTEEHMKE